jgi:hypothetical protein
MAWCLGMTVSPFQGQNGDKSAIVSLKNNTSRQFQKI